MATVTLDTIHKDLLNLKKEVDELKGVLYSEPELREEIVREVEVARQRMKTGYVKHEEMLKEFSSGEE